MVLCHFHPKIIIQLPTISSFQGVVMFCPCSFCPSDNFEHCLALPMRQCASVRTLFYWYLLCNTRRCGNSRKVLAPRRISALEAPHIVTWTKQTWIKHHNTQISFFSRGKIHYSRSLQGIFFISLDPLFIASPFSWAFELLRPKRYSFCCGRVKVWQ